MSSGPTFDYGWQLHSNTYKGLGIRDQIETSPYTQDIWTSVWTLQSHKYELLRLLLSLICTVCLIDQCIEDMAVLGSFSGPSFKLHKTCQSSV